VIRSGVRRLLQLPLRGRWERDVEDEIKLHLAMRAEQLMAEGRSADDAYAEAVRRFGKGSLHESRAQLFKAARHREQHMRRTEFIADLRQDVRFALRTLARQKVWTTVTVLTLALGIGATTAVFSVVSSLLLHAVPYPAADRVVLVGEEPTGGNKTGVQVSMNAPPPLFRAWRDNNRSFDAFEPYRSESMLMATSGDPSSISAARVLPSFAAFAGQQPIRGRLFTNDEVRDKAHVALLAEGFWRTRVGANERVLGQAIRLEDSLYTIIGIMPAGAQVPRTGRLSDDVWLPIDATNNRVGFHILGRLRPGVDAAAASRELDTLAARSGVFPKGKLPFVSRVAHPSQMVSFRDSLLMLMAAVAVVLLVSCTNVAHLLLARGAARRREIAVRIAMGAGRGRLLRQLTTESIIIAAGGAVLGVLLGWIGLHGLLAMRPSNMLELAPAHLDATTLWVAVGVAVATGLVFGSLGALQAMRDSVNDALKLGATSVSHSRRHDRVRSLLVISETALSASLLVGATLLVRSVINMQHTDLGFDPRQLYGVQMDLPESRYATEASRNAAVQAAVDRLRALPGITDVAAASVGPYGRQFRIGTLEIERDESTRGDGTDFIDVNGVQTGYFRTMRVPIVQGTTFTDTSENSTQVIVNAGYARKHWQEKSPVGARIRIAYQGKGAWLTIVGVAADAMLSGPVRETSAPFLYTPWAAGTNPSIMIRAAEGAEISPAVRVAMRSFDPHGRPPFVSSMSTLVQSAIGEPRFVMLILSAFTFLAVLLAAVGLYGVLSYSVAQRTREIGIRVALGATRGTVAADIVRRGMALAIIGAMIGLLAAYWARGGVEKLLFGVPSLDAMSFAAGGLGLLVAALLACIIPTRRALAVDPMTAIRAD
jgi:putative ABC transport system permease protein